MQPSTRHKPNGIPPKNLLQDVYRDLLLQDSHTRRVVSSFRCDLPPLTSDPHSEWRTRSRHLPPQRDIFLVLSGTFSYGLQGQTYLGSPGDLFLCNLGEVRDRFFPADAVSSTLLVFQVYKDFTMAYLSHFADGIQTISRRMVFADLSTTPLLNQSWDSIRRPDATIDPCSVRQFFLILDFMITEIVHHKPNPTSSITLLSGSQETLTAQQIVGLVMAHIDERKGRDCSLDEIASFSGYSAVHINRLFQANLGCSISEHANHWRINRYRELLHQGVSMKEASIDLGFSSPTAFSRWKRNNGL